MVDVSNNFFELFHNDWFFNYFFDFLYGFIFISDFNNFFVLSDDLFKLFNDNWDFNNLFNYVLDISVNVYQLRYNFFNLSQFRYLNNNFSYSLNLMNFWNCDSFFNNFLNNLLGSHYLLNCCLNWNNLFFNDLDLFNFVLNIWNLFDNFFNFLINNDLFFKSDNLNCFHSLWVLGNNLLYNSWHWNYLLDNFWNWYNFLDNFLDWYWNFNWNNNLFLDWNLFYGLNSVCDNFFNF